MKTKELKKLGVPRGEAMDLASVIAVQLASEGLDPREIGEELQRVMRHPMDFIDDSRYTAFIEALGKGPQTPAIDNVPYHQWGENLDPGSLEQMRNACQLPVAVAAALMPDAHLGYGIPIGGVLATENAVVPYAVGVDIACRLKLSVLDLPHSLIHRKRERLIKAIEKETRFGIGSGFQNKRLHPVLDEDWSVSPVTIEFRDRAWKQLGSSGSGNHFVEFGEFTPKDDSLGLEAGKTYLALLSHSGSRGTGAAVCSHYSKLAMKLHPELPKKQVHLAWLDLDTEEGQEYWSAMELMGNYASANHACIHKHITENLGAQVLFAVENHHNFAWKEEHQGRELIIHRKGATPAHEGALGIIPGSMASPGYVVRGKGNAESLRSAAHGAGRVMSRKKALGTFTWKDVQRYLANKNVFLISAGLDEVPMVYKNIHEVMAAQGDLVDTLGEFQPRLVKMAPPGERPED